MDQPTVPAASKNTYSGPLKRILMVEDDDALANVYLTRLKVEGFDVRRVKNGEDALAAARGHLNERSATYQFCYKHRRHREPLIPAGAGQDGLDAAKATTPRQRQIRGLPRIEEWHREHRV